MNFHKWNLPVELTLKSTKNTSGTQKSTFLPVVFLSQSFSLMLLSKLEMN